MEKIKPLTPDQLVLAVMKFPQIKERYVKKFERLVAKKRYRARIENLLSDFAFEVSILLRDSDIEDKNDEE